MDKIEKKREEEKQVINKMIQLYCHKNHQLSKGLCQECQELSDYASTRIDRCPFICTKSFCNQCKVHCYSLDHRERIRKVMRFSGPRMLFHNPIMVMHHAFSTIGNLIKNKTKKKS